MSNFSRPRRPNRASPDASEAFLAGAHTTPAIDPTLTVGSPPTHEPELHSQTVRFTDREKAIIERLARAQRRSQHFIIKDLLRPALAAADANAIDASATQ